MTPFALLVILACGLCWSGLDLARKALAGNVPAIPLVIVLTAGQALLMLGWLLHDGLPPVAAGYAAPAAASIALNVAANLMFIRAVRLSPLSLTVPYLSFTPVFTTLLAIPLLHEVPSARQLAGIALVAVGALALNVPGLNRLGELWQAFRQEPGSPLMVGVALLWSLSVPVDKLAMRLSGPWFHGVVITLGLMLCLLTWLALTRRLHELRTLPAHAAPLFGGALAGALALALQLWVMQWVLVGLVEALKRVVDLAGAVAWGRLFFAEPVTRQKLVAIALLAAGSALLLL